MGLLIMEAVRPACRGLTELVPEVLQHILRLLDDDTTYRNLPRVCRRFKALIGSPEFVGRSVLLAGADGPEERRRVRAMLRPCAVFPVLPTWSRSPPICHPGALTLVCNNVCWTAARARLW